MPHIPLRTASPVGPLDDLAPFLELAATRSVIGLGEATHGTSEAFQLKHRLIRALAEQGDLVTIAFECGLAGRGLEIFGTANLPTDTGAEPAPYRRFLGNLYDHEVNAQRPDASRIERPITDFDLIAWLPATQPARYLGATSLEMDLRGPRLILEANMP